MVMSTMPTDVRRRSTLARAAHHPVVLTALAYALSVTSMGTIGVIVPFLHRIAAELQTSPSAAGLGIALFSVPSALLATFGGEIMQRVGMRPAVIAASFAVAAGDLIVRSATGLWAFDAGLVLAGAGLAGLAIGCPSVLSAVLDGQTRTRAMTFWSTYAPTGFAVGLLIAVPFTAALAWRSAVLVHAVLACVVAIAGVALLPRAAAVQIRRTRMSLAEWLGVFRHLPALRLAACVAIPNGIAYGTSLVAPAYLARVHGVSLATSTGAVAAAKIVALVIGAVTTGRALTTGKSPRVVFGCMAALGALAQIVFFLPASSFAIAIAALMLWLFAFGGMSGTAWALLPRVVPGMGKEGSTAGLMNQMISAVSFAAPPTYFALSGWHSYVGLGWLGLACAFAVVPRLTIDR